MENGNDNSSNGSGNSSSSHSIDNNNRLSSGSLETIPEEVYDLPRISELIPKSPETRKKEQEYLDLYESQKQRIETFIEMLVVQRNIKRICTNDRFSMGKYDDYSNVSPAHAKTTTPTMIWFDACGISSPKHARLAIETRRENRC